MTRQELHEAICGVKNCTFKQRYISENVATQQLYVHLRTYHNVAIDPNAPSRDFFGWVKPLTAATTRRGGRQSGDPTSV